MIRKNGELSKSKFSWQTASFRAIARFNGKKTDPVFVPRKLKQNRLEPLEKMEIMIKFEHRMDVILSNHSVFL